VIILAAGRGSRMNSLTEDLPKCLLEVVGKPLLQHQINALKTAGITDLLIVTGYKRESLQGTGYN
jgi:NDP-sugar pyrophosphorylase family protein